ncbi:Uu.00g124190.m01.CDS01 [Anthostomella pinea]|uniref:Uu.00g124190.m01.CDS01 n=1 Tax=Anthostomella pinea TaxID=933095 RepID=A0AAI8YHG9_9PEZI|nr:Uu.00g124190.m01.CDS01 [Anthostomella pinea]
MGGQPIVILSSIKVAQDLISKRGSKYADRPRLIVAKLATRGMNIMLRSHDETFRLHQRLQAPHLARRAAKTYLPVQDLESKQLLFNLMTQGESDEGVDFHHEFERTTASIIYALIYEPFVKMLQVGAYLVDSFPSLHDLPLPGFLTPWKRDREENFQAQLKLHVANMQHGLENPATWNFTKEFEKSPERGQLSTEEVAFDLGILADAALDTTTMTLDWFVVAWITQQDTGFVAKAQQALDDVVGRNRLPSAADRARLPYIDAMVEEILRWRPIVGTGVAHAVRTEDDYDGYRIPAGSIVLINHWALCRDAAFGERVEDFVPEWWIVDGEVKDYFGSPVLGYGRRICPGRHIARNSRRFAVLPNAGTDSLLTKPLPFNA